VFSCTKRLGNAIERLLYDRKFLRLQRLKVFWQYGLSLSAATKGRHIPKANKAISVVFMPATLRLTGSGVNAVGGPD
jgi:hypothetical protein